MDGQVQYVLTLKDLLTGGIQNADNAANKLHSTMSSLQGAIGTAFGIAGITMFARSVADVGMKLEGYTNTLNFASGSTKEAAVNQEFLKDIVNDMKLPLMETTEGFSKFTSSVIGSGLEGQQTRDIFEGVSTAVTALHLPAERASLIFQALGQMASKGTVSAEELRQQLGESLPGAMQKAATAMGMTVAQFSKAMEQGLIKSAEFLPKFAAELKESYGAALPQALTTAQASMNEMNNAIIEMKAEIYDDLKPVMVDFFKAVSEGTKFIKEHWNVIKAVTISLAAMWAAYKAVAAAKLIINSLTFAMQAFAASNGTAALSLGALGRAATFALGPLGLIIAALGTVIALNAAAADATERTIELNQKRNKDDFDYKVSTYRADMADLAFKKTGQRTGSAYESELQRIKDERIKALNDVSTAANTAADSVFRGEKAWGAYKKSFSPQDMAIAKAALGLTDDAAMARGGNKPSTPAKVAPSPKTKATANKNVTINVSIQDLIKTFNINTTNVKEGMQEMGKLVTRSLAGAINDFQIVAGE